MRGTGRALRALDAALSRSGAPQVRYWAQITMIDRRFGGATGEGVYIAVASRIVKEQARAELKHRGNAWRAAGFGPFSTVEVIRAGGGAGRMLTLCAYSGPSRSPIPAQAGR